MKISFPIATFSVIVSTMEEPQVTNSTLQADEIEALSAIFGDEWILEDDNVYSITICNSSGNKVYFQITFPVSYPLCTPPSYQISAPWMTRVEKSNLSLEIDNIYSQNIGESIIYLWIDKVRNFIEQEACLEHSGINAASVAEDDVQDVQIELENVSFFKDVDELPSIKHGEPIIDRKSVFQAHVARVVSVDQVKQVLEKLKENRKIATATHNIHAYRIACQNNSTFIQDCEDDGETKAGSGLLHLLQVLDVHDILVVVSRWYGGIHLGPDRFKHINNAARILLNQLGFIKDEKTRRSTKSRKKYLARHT